MGKYNVIGSFMQGQEGRRAADEANYIAQRRAIVDPRTDRQAADLEAARAANIAKYGVQAADPTSLGQLEGIQDRRDLKPGVMEQQGLTTESMKLGNAGQGLSNTSTQLSNEGVIDARARDAASRTLDAIEESGATTVQEIAQRIPPAVMASFGTDPAKVPQLLETLASFPDLKTGIAAMRDGLLGNEKVTATLTGMGPDGKPIYFNQGDRASTGAVQGVTPGGPNDDLNRQLLAAQVEATRALANQRNTPAAPKAGTKTPEQMQQAAARATMLIDDAMALVAEGARKGYIPSNAQDGMTRGGAQAAQLPIIGPLVQGVVSPEAQTLRDQITSKTNALLREYTQAMGIMSTSINSNFELQNIQSIIDNAGASAETRLEALATVKQLLSDPQFATRVLAAEGAAAAPATGQPAPAVPVAGGNLAQRQDGVYVWTPGTD